VQSKTWLAAALICTLLPFAGQFYGDRAGGWLGIDFRAYYCAALAQREHSNPYYAQSIHQCERQTPSPYYRAPTGVTVPAPYPPYALAFFYPFTFLPFGLAMAVWWLVLLASLALAASALAKTAAQPWLAGWAALVLSLGLSSLTSGNVVTLAVAAIVLAAYLLQKGRIVGASLAAIFALIEPQIGLPALIPLFIFAPASRLALAGGVAALGFLSLLAVGFSQTLSYVTQVIPAHALSEVSRDNQYSISTVLSALGTPDAVAAFAGSVSYLVMGTVGVVAALSLARRYRAPALAVLLPPAIALLGGAFVHTGEIGIAAPACLVLFARSDAYRGWLLTGLILLAVPWMLATSAAMFLAPVFPAAYLAYTLSDRNRALALGVALSSCVLIVSLFALSAAHLGSAIVHHTAHPPIDPRLAEASWRQLVLGNTTNRPIMWLLRIPTWIGLIALAAVSIALARKQRFALCAAKLLESRA
jgi:hypothetical protein